MGDRKARLAALAAKAGRTKSALSEEETKDDETEESKKSISFRNYVPNDSSMEPEEEGSANKRMRVEECKTSSLEEALQEAQNELATTVSKDAAADIASMAPKKVNWDLKRDIEKKLAQLERKTQKAIVELLKERLDREATEQAESDASDLD